MIAEEARPIDHVCQPNEIEQGEEYFGRKQDGSDDEDSDFDVSDDDEVRASKSARATSKASAGKRKRHTSHGDEEVEEDFVDDDEATTAAAQSRSMAKPRHPAISASSPGRSTTPRGKSRSAVLSDARGSHVGATSPTHDPTVRSKVRDAFASDLEMAVEEIKASDPTAELPSPTSVAAALEDALVRLFGE